MCANGALLLAQLYNLGAIHCNLIYELVRRMVGAIGENSRKTEDDWHFQTKRAGPAPPPAKGAAVDTSVWLGKIPHGLCHVSASACGHPAGLCC